MSTTNHACGIHFIKFWFEMNFSRLNNTWKIHVSTLCMWKNPWTFRSKTCFQSVHLHTVDGRNPKQPPGMYQILQIKLNNGKNYHINWWAGFLNHQQYVSCIYSQPLSAVKEAQQKKPTSARVAKVTNIKVGCPYPCSEAPLWSLITICQGVCVIHGDPHNLKIGIL